MGTNRQRQLLLAQILHLAARTSGLSAAEHMTRAAAGVSVQLWLVPAKLWTSARHRCCCSSSQSACHVLSC